MYFLMICLLPYGCILASLRRIVLVYLRCQRAMDQCNLLGLCVAKYHDFDEVTQGQKPLKTYGLLKECIGPQREGLSLHGRVV